MKLQNYFEVTNVAGRSPVGYDSGLRSPAPGPPGLPAGGVAMSDESQ